VCVCDLIYITGDEITLPPIAAPLCSCFMPTPRARAAAAADTMNPDVNYGGYIHIIGYNFTHGIKGKTRAFCYNYQITIN
jgi:hypothetical protein